MLRLTTFDFVCVVFCFRFGLGWRLPLRAATPSLAITLLPEGEKSSCNHGTA